VDEINITLQSCYSNVAQILAKRGKSL